MATEALQILGGCLKTSLSVGILIMNRSKSTMNTFVELCIKVYIFSELSNVFCTADYVEHYRFATQTFTKQNRKYKILT